MKKLISIIISITAIIVVCAQGEWIHIFTRDGKVNTGLVRDFESLEYLQYDSISPDTLIIDTTIIDTVIVDTTVVDTAVDTPITDTLVIDTAATDDVPTDTVAADTIHPDNPALPDMPDKIYVGCDSVEVRRSNGIARYAIEDIDSIIFGTNIPTIRIDIEDGAEVTSKTDYRNAIISVEGYGAYEDFESQPVQIRGRGNATWGYPKKPYRLKFEKKQSLCGMKKAKSYVLLANQIDCSLMRNAISMQTARMLGMPFTNTIIPVNLIVNGTYRGSYNLTEKVGINSGSVDIDEETGIFWEIDSYFDEDYRFKSDIYNLPVMVKDPDIAEIALIKGMNPEYLLTLWQVDFNTMERSVWTNEFYITNPDKERPDTGSDWTEYIDITSLANFLLVNDLAWNAEISYPKSTYLYKGAEGDRYVMGPVWDFDWAYNFPERDAQTHSHDYIFDDAERPGSRFFRALWSDGRLREAFKERFEYYRGEILPELLEYIDSYAAYIEVSALQNAERWPEAEFQGIGTVYSSEQPKKTVGDLKQWLLNRVDFIATDPNFGLFRQ